MFQKMYQANWYKFIIHFNEHTHHSRTLTIIKDQNIMKRMGIPQGTQT